MAKEFEADHDDYKSIMVKAVADRLAEALAEYLHQEIRMKFWGYASQEQLHSDDLIHEKYVGIRPAPGYPASPDHTEKETIWKLLDVEKNTGIQLTDNMAMWPAASVSGYYFASKYSQYFALGKIKRDQLEDYAKRKQISVEEAEKWLSQNLAD
jgi:5-methyltetrahydrofolate--homocysteine methyltransferase